MGHWLRSLTGRLKVRVSLGDVTRLLPSMLATHATSKARPTAQGRRDLIRPPRRTSPSQTFACSLPAPSAECMFLASGRRHRFRRSWTSAQCSRRRRGHRRRSLCCRHARFRRKPIPRHGSHLLLRASRSAPLARLPLWNILLPWIHLSSRGRARRLGCSLCLPSTQQAGCHRQSRNRLTCIGGRARESMYL